MTPESQQTIARPVELRGWGVHSGSAVRLVLRPAPAGHGVRFCRTDPAGAGEIPARVEYLSDTRRGTNLRRERAEVRTVEHLLAAVCGMGIDNLLVELDAPELPIADGSCLEFVRILESAGLRSQDRPRRLPAISRPLRVEDGGSWIVLEPDEGLSLECRIELPGRPDQVFAWKLEPGSFQRELAPARTFGFVEEAELLLRKGLIRGTALDNTVVVAGPAVISRGGLRFKDEFARHKAADLLGDLFLAGGPPRARIKAFRPGHGINHRAARAIIEEVE